MMPGRLMNKQSERREYFLSGARRLQIHLLENRAVFSFMFSLEDGEKYLQA